MRRPTLASLHLSTNLYNFWNGLFFLVNKKYASTTPKRPWSHYVSVATLFGRAKLVSLTKVPFGMSLRLKLVIFILILVRRRNVSDRNTKHYFSTFFLIQFFEVNLLPKFVVLHIDRHLPWTKKHFHLLITILTFFFIIFTLQVFWQIWSVNIMFSKLTKI